MDIFRILLCIGLVALLWRLELRGTRPVRDFFLWGVDYPFHFLLTATLILVIWGALGSSFGLQGLFLAEDPLTQLLLGATLMLLFAAITVQYVALGSSQRGWWNAVEQVCRFLEGLNRIAGPDRPVQSALANGFLEHLRAGDLEAIRRAAAVANRPPTTPPDEPVTPPATRQTLELLASQPFRLLFAPAIVLVKGFGLIVLVGVVPAVLISLSQQDPAGIVERLPWLVGVCLGSVLAVVLGCWTTAWLERAAAWEARAEAIRTAIGQLPSPPPDAEAACTTPPPRWLTVLAWFFGVHVATTLLLPDAVTARWIAWPEQTLVEPTTGSWSHPHGLLANFPWLPAVVLAAEAGLAALLATGVQQLRQRESVARRLNAWRPLAAAAMQ